MNVNENEWCNYRKPYISETENKTQKKLKKKKKETEETNTSREGGGGGPTENKRGKQTTRQREWKRNRLLKLKLDRTHTDKYHGRTEAGIQCPHWCIYCILVHKGAAKLYDGRVSLSLRPVNHLLILLVRTAGQVMGFVRTRENLRIEDSQLCLFCVGLSGDVMLHNTIILFQHLWKCFLFWNLFFFNWIK